MEGHIVRGSGGRGRAILSGGVGGEGGPYCQGEWTEREGHIVRGSGGGGGGEGGPYCVMDVDAR